MARMRVFLVLVLAIGAGSVFAFATYNYVQNMPAKVVSIPTKPVMVAAVDLDIGAEITAEMSARLTGRPIRCRRSRTPTPRTSSAAASSCR